MKDLVTIEELFVAMATYPRHVSIRFGSEAAEDGTSFLWASIYEEAPEGGWASQGAYHRSMKGAIHWGLPPHPEEKYAAAGRVSVTARDAKTLARLATRMIRRHVQSYVSYPPTQENALTIEQVMASGRGAS